MRPRSDGFFRGRTSYFTSFAYKTAVESKIAAAIGARNVRRQLPFCGSSLQNEVWILKIILRRSFFFSDFSINLGDAIVA